MQAELTKVVKTDSAMCVYDSLQSEAERGGFIHVCMLLDTLSVQANSYILSARLLLRNSTSSSIVRAWCCLDC